MPLSKAAMRERKQADRGVKPNPDTYQNTPIMSRAARLRRLSQIADLGNIKQTNPVEAIKEINKMLGDYAPIKHAIAKRVELVISYVDKITTPDTLPETVQSTISPVEEDSDILVLEGEDEGT